MTSGISKLWHFESITGIPVIPVLRSWKTFTSGCLFFFCTFLFLSWNRRTGGRARHVIRPIWRPHNTGKTILATDTQTSEAGPANTFQSSALLALILAVETHRFPLTKYHMLQTVHIASPSVK